MSTGHFFGAHQKLDLRPLGGPDLFVLELGDQYCVTDRAGRDRLWEILDRERKAAGVVDRMWTEPGSFVE